MFQLLSYLPDARLQLRIRVFPQFHEPAVVVARAARVAPLLVQLAQAPIGRSQRGALLERAGIARRGDGALVHGYGRIALARPLDSAVAVYERSEEHTSELQSLADIVCR